jgi:tRNA nucleotidyltransferase (CCA-adding enzyme)
MKYTKGDFMQFKIPKHVELILFKIEAKGFKAYLVGGCVRDLLLGIDPKDWDIATDAFPEDIKGLFSRTFDMGIKHGTVIVLEGGIHYEITTFKKGLHQESKTDILFDLSKRDLTINAMAYHMKEGLIDPFGGQEDLAKKQIQGVLNPEERIQEDPLRILRGVRFSAQFQFSICDSFLVGAKKNAFTIEGVSVERIREELTKILRMNPTHLEILHELGILKWILPEFDQCFGVEQKHPYHIYDVARHTIHALEHVEKSTVLVWACLLHDLGKVETKTTGEDGVDHFYGHIERSVEIGKQILRRYKFDHDSSALILSLIQYHDRKIFPSKKSIKKLLAILGKENFLLLLKLKKADNSGKNTKLADFTDEKCKSIETLLAEIERRKECYSLKELAINGKHLKDMGIHEGEKIGRILNQLLDKVIEDPAKNTEEKLKEIVIGTVG